MTHQKPPAPDGQSLVDMPLIWICERPNTRRSQAPQSLAQRFALRTCPQGRRLLLLRYKWGEHRKQENGKKVNVYS